MVFVTHKVQISSTIRLCHVHAVSTATLNCMNGEISIITSHGQTTIHNITIRFRFRFRLTLAIAYTYVTSDMIVTVTM